MNKRFFLHFIIYSVAAVQLFAVETVRFQEQAYSGSGRCGVRMAFDKG